MSDSPVPEVARRDGEHDGAVQKMFERIAPTYDLLNHVMSAGIDVRWRKKAVRELRGAGGALLDLCAGTMDLTALLDEEYPRSRIVAADFSAAMLEKGKKKAPRAEVVVADAHALPFADEEFGGIICGFGMRNLSEPSIGAREAWRVLAPGGVFVTLEFFKPTGRAQRLFHAAYNRVVLPAVGGVVSGDRNAYRYLAKSMEGFLTRAEYEDVLREAGFENVVSQELTLGVASIVRAEVSR